MATMTLLSLHARQVLDGPGDAAGGMYSWGTTILPVWPTCRSFGA